MLEKETENWVQDLRESGSEKSIHVFKSKWRVCSKAYALKRDVE
ncbi:hypothetical protein PPOLYM_03104 [Paenibacillus polymyxa]|jgi:hypothetical protein|nr:MULTISPECIES: hypothetical protein [Paenibacillus]SFR03163.1 hypothetical protein SAMN04488603_1011264 [Paenibacillus sp. cl130]VUG06703.1 hypothetical protein PPOLYM_03104 [Paenibacillus polymyxa]